MTIEDRMKTMLEDAKQILKEEKEESGKGITNWKRKQEKENEQRRGEEKRRKIEETIQKEEEDTAMVKHETEKTDGAPSDRMSIFVNDNDILNIEEEWLLNEVIND